MIGLAATLDMAKPGDRIFVTSFGSGAGADSFDIEVTDAIEAETFRRGGAPTVRQLLSNRSASTTHAMQDTRERS